MSLDIYRLAFARVKGLRPDIAREILSRTGSEEAFMTLSEGQLRAMLGFDGKFSAMPTATAFWRMPGAKANSSRRTA